jgi:hypothetical protein
MATRLTIVGRLHVVRSYEPKDPHRRSPIADAGVTDRLSRRHGRVWRNDQTATTPATHLAAFAACGPRFVSSPFMSRAFFVCGATALAGNLALLLGRHRCETSSFFAFSCIHRNASDPGDIKWRA